MKTQRAVLVIAVAMAVGALFLLSCDDEEEGTGTCFFECDDGGGAMQACLDYGDDGVDDEESCEERAAEGCEGEDKVNEVEWDEDCDDCDESCWPSWFDISGP